MGIGVPALPEPHLVWFLHFLRVHLHGPCMPRMEKGGSCLGYSEVAHFQRREIWLCDLLGARNHLHLIPRLCDVHETISGTRGETAASARACRCIVSKVGLLEVCSRLFASGPL